jgi:predicted amidohydrolase YtcJ
MPLCSKEDVKEPRPDRPAKREGDQEEVVRFLVSVKWPFRLHATYGESIERELAVFEQIASDASKEFVST